ncbi:MAG: VTT domain-containing protein [Clostridia bacterium]|nr:VTT domain-containing protein [Clostridia bacterium]
MQVSATKKKKLIALAIFIVVFIGLLVFLFYGDNFNVLKEIFNTNATKDQIQDSIGKLGIRAYIVVFILSMLQVILTFVPAEPLHVIAGISFGLWKGMAVCLAGIMVGNTIIFILYKLFGTKLTDYFATNVEFDFNAVKSSNKLALIVIILYCLPAIPYGIICFFAATMGMKYPKYILITGIGSIPSLILDVGLGHITMSTSWAVSIIVFVVIILLLILMYKYKTQIFKKVNEFVKKNQEKAKNKVGSYNPFVFKGLGSLILAGVKTKAKVKLKNNVGKIEKPCVVLCNHGSFYDFIYSGKILFKEKPHYIVARLYFGNKKLAWVLNKTGAFPKSLMAADLETTKNCLKVVAGKGVLVMMPEGRLSTAGQFEDIQEATYKFLQKMNIAVYTIKINGSYLAKPKWGDKVRKGALVEAELNPLFNAGELASMPVEQIKEKTENALKYDEWQWLKSHPEIHYKHKNLAVGLENILFTCPKCGKKYTLKTDKNKITCTECNLEVTLDDRYQLSGVEFKNIAEWYNWQANEIRKEINKNKDFSLQSEVELRHFSKDGKTQTIFAGNGKCILNKAGLLYKGTENGVEIEKLFTMESIHRLLFGAGENFEIYEGKEIFYFVPTNKRSCVEWYIVSGLLKE